MELVRTAVVLQIIVWLCTEIPIMLPHNVDLSGCNTGLLTQAVSKDLLLEECQQRRPHYTHNNYSSFYKPW